MWPVILQWDGFTLYSYPLFIGLAWGIGFRLCEVSLPAEISPRSFAAWFAGLFISTWIGAKAFFVLTQNQYAAVDLVLASNFWLGGGFVFLGGFLGGLLYTLVLSHFTPFKWRLMQFTVVPLLWSHAVGRVGCFLAGCCFGTESSLPWALHLHGVTRHPVQLYEAMALALLALVLTQWQKHQRFLMLYLLGYGSIRWSLEWLRADEIRGLAGGMSSSQWIAVGMILASLILYIQQVTSKIRNPGP